MLIGQTRDVQARIDAGLISYNQAFDEHYGEQSPWSRIASWQCADEGELEREHARNRAARHRVVGLVVETRPDLITPQTLNQLRPSQSPRVVDTLDEGFDADGITVDFVAYGLYHGLLLAACELIQRKWGFYKKHKKDRWFRICSWAVTMIAVFYGFALFSGQALHPIAV